MTYASLPLQAGTLASLPDARHKPAPAQPQTSIPAHTEDKAPKLLDATIIKAPTLIKEDKVAQTAATTVGKTAGSMGGVSSKSADHSITASSVENKKASISPSKTTDVSKDGNQNRVVQPAATTVGKTAGSLGGVSAKPAGHSLTASSGEKKTTPASAPKRTVTASSVENKKASISPSKTTDVSQDGNRPPSGNRLARITAYWASEGDYYTSQGISSTGIHLHDGYCAVDPTIIPYGSVVTISGLGKYLAVDTGSAVISRTAARETGHTATERAALVIDLYFESRREGEDFAANGPKFASITWQAPDPTNRMSSDVRNMVAESDWNKLRTKVLSE
ncbi:MAG TPA: 3D domain-containing protein [Candidatus Methylacidiphilales bacterium]|nr:3D domain-containing protein [Candidatus Methylacidiphilales bacterium]